VVVDNLDLGRTISCPDEADTILLVYPDAVLALPITGKNLKSIPNGDSKILELLRRIELLQPSPGNTPKGRRTSPTGPLGPSAIEHVFRGSVLE
jgi:hypothetical protein